jgi:hypothetical protein
MLEKPTSGRSQEKQFEMQVELPTAEPTKHNPSKFNTGEMPNTHFMYEEFEGFLGNCYLSLSPLRDGDKQDKADFQIANQALNNLAKSQNVQMPEVAVMQPRKRWIQPKTYETPLALLNSFDAFWSKFHIGEERDTLDNERRATLTQTVLRILDRHGAITAYSANIEGKQVVVGFDIRCEALISSPLEKILRMTK